MRSDQCDHVMVSSVTFFIFLSGRILDYTNQYLDLYLFKQGHKSYSTIALQCYFNVTPGRVCEGIWKLRQVQCIPVWELPTASRMGWRRRFPDPVPHVECLQPVYPNKQQPQEWDWAHHHHNTGKVVHMDYEKTYLYFFKQGHKLYSTGSLQCYFNVTPGRVCKGIGKLRQVQCIPVWELPTASSMGCQINGDFKITMWNVFTQCIRTNNRVEGWHHKNNRVEGWHHKNNRVEGWHHNISSTMLSGTNTPTHELISVLKKEQTSTEETLQRAR